MRTDDVHYGHDYFETLDGGQGYQDSTMWEDIAHTVKEVMAIDRAGGHDMSAQLNLIDVGCAKGYLVRHLRRRGFDAWGVDFADYALQTAPEDTMEYLRWFDLTGVDHSFFGPEAFWIATCFETMEHIPEEFVQRALTHVRNLLRSGGHGRVLFTICTDKQPDWASDPTHVTIRPREWWEEQLDDAGFAYTTKDAWMEKEFRRFWLFSQHDGVFVRLKP